MTESHPTSQKASLLIVDDEESLLRLISSFLKDNDYQVRTAGGGREALSLFSSDPQSFDLVVTDYQMPGMNGMDLTKWLHRLRSHLPVILCSGAFVPPDPLPAFMSFLSKPYQLKNLLSEIEKALFEGVGETALSYDTLPELERPSVSVGAAK